MNKSIKPAISNYSLAMASTRRSSTLLGEGSYGRILLAVQDGVKVALKHLFKDPQVIGSAYMRELQITSMLSASKYCVQLKDVSFSSHIESSMTPVKDLCKEQYTGLMDDPLFLFMHAEQINLIDYINSKSILDVSKTKLLAYRIAIGLHAVHTRNIVHYDLSPSNILVTFDAKGLPVPKIADFGLSMFTIGGLTENVIATTKEFRAPECNTSSQPVDLSVDIWSYGKVLYELFADLSPDEFEDLYKKCCSTKPNDRPTISQVLSHPFFKTIDPSLLESLTAWPSTPFAINVTENFKQACKYGQLVMCAFPETTSKVLFMTIDIYCMYNYKKADKQYQTFLNFMLSYYFSTKFCEPLTNLKSIQYYLPFELCAIKDIAPEYEEFEKDLFYVYEESKEPYSFYRVTFEEYANTTEKAFSLLIQLESQAVGTCIDSQTISKMLLSQAESSLKASVQSKKRLIVDRLKNVLRTSSKGSTDS